MAKHGNGKRGGGPSYEKADGKQGIKAGSDFGARALFEEATSPPSVKAMVSGGQFAKTKHGQK
jgi:hypothetical protein